MAGVGIGITGEYPKPWTDEIVRAADVVITIGCGDACPIFPGSATRTGNSQTRPAKVSTPSGPSATTFEEPVHRRLAELNVPEPDYRENPREHHDMTATTSESQSESRMTAWPTLAR
jgi:protein-tyrosine-phosphatase